MRQITWRYDIELEVLVSTLHRPIEEQDGAWNLHATDVWTVPSGDFARGGDTHTHTHQHDDESAFGTAYGLGIFEFEEFDIREFDGDEPEMAELVLVEEESAMMELDISQ